MIAGFESHSVNGVVQINSESKTASVVARGSVTTNNFAGYFGNATITFPTGLTAPPLLLLRMPANAWICCYYTSNKEAFISAPPNTTVEWMLASNQGVPESDGSNVGLQLFNESGELTFSSSYRYPRIVAEVSQLMPQFYAGPMAHAIPALASRPWLVANPLNFSYEAPDGGSGSYPPYAFTARVNAQNTVITLECRGSELFVPVANGTDIRNMSPYSFFPLRVSVCVIPGS